MTPTSHPSLPSRHPRTRANRVYHSPPMTIRADQLRPYPGVLVHRVEASPAAQRQQFRRAWGSLPLCQIWKVGVGRPVERVYSGRSRRRFSLLCRCGQRRRWVRGWRGNVRLRWLRRRRRIRGRQKVLVLARRRRLRRSLWVVRTSWKRGPRKLRPSNPQRMELLR